MNILVIPDAHAKAGETNERADWLGRLMYDHRAYITHVVNIGDLADMASLHGFDKGARASVGDTYQKDVEAAIEFNDRLFHQFKKNKKKKPVSYILHGNHEQRIERAISYQPVLAGKISYSDLQYESYYDEVIPYEGSTPGILKLNGVNFAHYMVSGSMGRPIGGDNIGSSLLSKMRESCVVGHSHVFDHSVRTSVTGLRMHGMSVGVYQEHQPHYVGGQGNSLWWRGAIVLKSVENGDFDTACLRIESIRFKYGEDVC